MIKKSLPSSHQQEELLGRYASVFHLAQQRLQSPPHSRVHHRIDTGTLSPIRQRPYRVSPAERKVIAEQVTDMLQKGVIQQSNSPWAAPVILVRKKDNSWRFCVDYRRLNAVTKDVYPLPRIDEAFDCLHSALYFASVDLRSGCWQIPMHPPDKKKTAFIPLDGLLDFNVMPLGLCNAQATLERFMATILCGL